MASIATDCRGRRRILFLDPTGARKTIRLGRLDRKAAESIRCHVEAVLAAKITGQPVRQETAVWLAQLGEPLRTRLARVGLIEASLTLGMFLETWLESRRTAGYKPASLVSWGLVIRALVRFFGVTCPLTAITPAQAEAFRQSLIGAGLRPATIQKRLQHARMFFADAQRQGLIAVNPFAFVGHRAGNVAERRAYVPADVVQRVLDQAPNWVWRLLIALSRFAGLRVPSEALSLRWCDVLWDAGRLAVPSPKTEYLAGHGYRMIPIFPELAPYLQEAWEVAPEGAVYVFPDEYRRRAHGPAGWVNCNLRTQLLKIIRRAGVEPWPRLWHSMRASCETDLAQRYPLAVVAKWLGNTQAVALRHYVDVTDKDFERGRHEGLGLRPCEHPQSGAKSGAPAAQNAAQ